MQTTNGPKHLQINFARYPKGYFCEICETNCLGLAIRITTGRVTSTQCQSCGIKHPAVIVAIKRCNTAALNRKIADGAFVRTGRPFSRRKRPTATLPSQLGGQ